MYVNATTSYFSPVAAVTGSQTTPASGSPDRNGDVGKRVHHSHGGHGHMQQALTQALQSLGLTVPTDAAATASASATATGSASTSASGGADASTPSVGDIKHDMTQFMHALFQAARSDVNSAGAGSASTPTGSADSKGGFASGLSALIADASNGSAPTALQDAFAKLTSDLQSVGATSGSAGTGTGSSAGSSTPPTLQALLATLQQDLGYSNASGAASAAIGNTVSAVA